MLFAGNTDFSVEEVAVVSDGADSAYAYGIKFNDIQWVDEIEESFQTFLGSHKGSLENLTVQELQGWFNRWLDSVYLELDDMKDKEIEKKII